ncbi:hypothetical protein P9112_007313 [Eukaryota sp. TZLM1-RC]
MHPSSNGSTVTTPTFSTRSIYVSGLETAFPYESPYPTQLDFMAAVYRALDTATNAILESPTGCGKTACLLASTLSYTQNHKLRSQNQQDYTPIKIVYASRTHSQLKQVAAELKKLPLKVHPTVSMLAGRDRYCLNDNVRNKPGSAQGAMCNRYLKACPFAAHEAKDLRFNSLNIEDFARVCEERNFCPYLTSRSLAKEADVILMPYNYLLSSSARNQLKFDLKNSIIILDEAHNIADAASQEMSVDLSSSGLIAAVSEIDGVLSQIQSNLQSNLIDHSADTSSIPDHQRTLAQFNSELLILKRFCQALATSVLNLAKELDSSNIFKDFEGPFIEKLFSNYGKLSFNGVLLESVISRLLSNYLTQSVSRNSKGTIALLNLQNLLTIVYGAFTQSMSKWFKVIVSKGKALNNHTANQKDDVILSYWCFSGSVVMKSLLLNAQPKSILLASGTLSPLPALKYELGIPFLVEFQGNHIVDKSRILFLIVENGPAGKLLDSSYKNRSNSGYISDLGTSIYNYVQSNRDGSLVFFPSFNYLEQCVKEWDHEDINKGMQSLADVYFERPINQSPSDDVNTVDYNQIITSFSNSINNQRRAVLYGVCRGRASEGMDFKDRSGRLVMVPGIPFPQLNDPRVILKRKFLDQDYQDRSDAQKAQNLVLTRVNVVEKLTGQDWYLQSAMRAVNQAIGRIIRHKSDYGAIVLMDKRFSGLLNHLPNWLKSNVKICKNFGDSLRELNSFYQKFEPDRKELIETKRIMTPKMRPVKKSEFLTPIGSNNTGINKLFNKINEKPSIHQSNRQPVSVSPAQHLSAHKFSATSPLSVRSNLKYRPSGLTGSFAKSPEVKRPRQESDPQGSEDSSKVMEMLRNSLTTEDFSLFTKILKEFTNGDHTVYGFANVLVNLIGQIPLVSSVGSFLPPKKRKLFNHEVQKASEQLIQKIIDISKQLLDETNLFLLVSSLHQLTLKDFCIFNFAELVNTLFEKQIDEESVVKVIQLILKCLGHRQKDDFIGHISPLIRTAINI